MSQNLTLMGNLLLESKKINQKQLESCIEYQNDNGCKLGEAAIALGFITQTDVNKILAYQFDYSYVSADDKYFNSKFFMAFDSFNPNKEKIKSLRSALTLEWFKKDNHSLLVTAINDDISSVTTAVNLAISYAQFGYKSLLIDADLRDQAMSKLIRLDGDVGLSDVLVQRAEIESVIQKTPIANLSIIGSGTVVPNPQELLGREIFNRINTQLSDVYDVIIYTTTTHIDYFDSQVVASITGSAVIHVTENVTQISDMKSLIDRFQTAEANVLGCIYLEE